MKICPHAIRVLEKSGLCYSPDAKDPSAPTTQRNAKSTEKTDQPTPDATLVNEIKKTECHEEETH